MVTPADLRVSFRPLESDSNASGRACVKLSSSSAHYEKGVTAALEIIEKEIHAGMMLTGAEDVTRLPPGFVLGQA